MKNGDLNLKTLQESVKIMKNKDQINKEVLKKLSPDELKQIFLISDTKPDIIIESKFAFYKRKFLREFKLSKYNVILVFNLYIIPFSVIFALNHKIECESFGIRKFSIPKYFGIYMLFVSCISLSMALFKYTPKESIIVKLDNIDNLTNDKIMKKIKTIKQDTRKELSKTILK